MAEAARYGTQTKARRVALDILYAAELRGRGIVETFIEARDLASITVRELTTRIVHGIAEHQEQIELSRQYERMPKPTLIAAKEYEDGDLYYNIAGSTKK